VDERYMENSARMRDFNRSRALALYYGLALPEPPLLLQADGSEARYAVPPGMPAGPQPGGARALVGEGPDRWGYHAVIDPGSHQPFAMIHDPAAGGIWCLVEAPSPEGGMGPKWIRIM
jgi:hypothetical protein